MGFIWKDIDGSRFCFLSCDNCAVLVESMYVHSLNIPEIVQYMYDNNWVSVEADKSNGWISQSFCPECAKALGIKSKPIRKGRILYEC